MKIYLNENERDRARMLVGEIQDFLNSIGNEVYKEKAYRTYLEEKMKGLLNDVNCLNSLISYLGEENE